MCILQANKVNPADRYAPADFVVRKDDNMSWQKITLTNEQVMYGTLDYILNQYLPLVVETQNKSFVSPFMSKPNANRITTVYFPPGSSPVWDKILLEFSSIPCEEPTESLTPMVRLNQSAK